MNNKMKIADAEAACSSARITAENFVGRDYGELCESCDKMKQKACWEIIDNLGIYFLCNGCREMGCIYQIPYGGKTRRELILQRKAAEKKPAKMRAKK